MCLNKSWIINPYTKKKYYVKCGRCAECRQELANKRAHKIVLNNKAGFVPLFVHLTYSDCSVPYVRKSELSLFSDSFNVYRDCKVRRKRFSADYKTENSYVYETQILGTLDKSEFEEQVLTDSLINSLKPLNGNPDVDRVGIIYYSDVQKFIKRLKSYVRYHKEIFSVADYKFDVYITSEYGEKTFRPHFHLLLFVPIKQFKDIYKWKTAIASNWPYSLFDLTYRHIEVAKNAASYVASYTNCSLVIPKVLQSKSLKPKSSHSLHFGFGYGEMSFIKILENIRDHDSCYLEKFVGKDGVCSKLYIPYPSYVSRRYFPKFKGSCSLDDSTLCRVLNNPVELIRHSQKLGYYKGVESFKRIDVGITEEVFIDIPEKLYSTIKFLQHKKEQFDYFISLLSYDEYNLFNFPIPAENQNTLYGHVWLEYYRKRQRSVWKHFYENQVDERSIIESYDNSYNCQGYQETFPKVSFDYANPNYYLSNLIDNQKNMVKYKKHHHVRRVNYLIYGEY